MKIKSEIRISKSETISKSKYSKLKIIEGQGGLPPCRFKDSKIKSSYSCFFIFFHILLLFFPDYYKIKTMKGILIIVLIALAIVVFLLVSKESPSGETYTDHLVRGLTQAEKLALDSKITAIKQALESYNLDNDSYPATLDVLVPNYLRVEEYIRDPWGERFELETDAENHLILISPGKDRVLGNDDDIRRRLQ